MPADGPRQALETEVRRLAEAGRHDDAAALAIRELGPEVYGFLLAQHASEADAAEVFSDWSERFWRTLATLTWQCGLRTWAYLVARSASVDHARRERRRARYETPDASAELARQVAAEVRSRTHPALRSETRARIAALRETLAPDDQALLTMRLDRQLEWKDLARIWLGEETPAEAALTREAARLRKRFQLVKERLVALARAEGLLDAE